MLDNKRQEAEALIERVGTAKAAAILEAVLAVEWGKVVVHIEAGKIVRMCREDNVRF